MTNPARENTTVTIYDMKGTHITIPHLPEAERVVRAVRRRLEAQYSEIATMRFHVAGTEDQLNDNDTLRGDVTLFVLPCIHTYPEVTYISFLSPFYSQNITQYPIRSPIIVHAPPLRRIGETSLLEIPQTADGAAFCRFLQQCETVITRRRPCMPILLTHSRYPFGAPRINVDFVGHTFSPDRVLPASTQIALTSLIKHRTDTVARVCIHVL